MNTDMNSDTGKWLRDGYFYGAANDVPQLRGEFWQRIIGRCIVERGFDFDFNCSEG